MHLPALIGALELHTPEVVADAEFQVDHEETVETSEDLQTLQAGVVDTVGLPALTMEIDIGPEEIVDLTPSLMIQSGDVVAVANTHAAAGNTLLAALDEALVAGLVENSNSSYLSSNSLHEDATDQVLDPLPAPTLEGRGEPEVGASLALVEETEPLLAPEAEETEPLLALEAEETEVFVEESDHNIDHEDEGDLALQDPLAVLPVLLNLGFGRVQTAYDQWLQNMSHVVSLFQGKPESL